MLECSCRRKQGFTTKTKALVDLPRDCCGEIFGFLHVSEVCKMRPCSTEMHRIVNHALTIGRDFKFRREPPHGPRTMAQIIAQRVRGDRDAYRWATRIALSGVKVQKLEMVRSISSSDMGRSYSVMCDTTFSDSNTTSSLWQNLSFSLNFVKTWLPFS